MFFDPLYSPAISHPPEQVKRVHERSLMNLGCGGVEAGRRGQSGSLETKDVLGSYAFIRSERVATAVYTDFTLSFLEYA